MAHELDYLHLESVSIYPPDNVNKSSYFVNTYVDYIAREMNLCKSSFQLSRGYGYQNL